MKAKLHLAMLVGLVSTGLAGGLAAVTVGAQTGGSSELIYRAYAPQVNRADEPTPTPTPTPRPLPYAGPIESLHLASAS